VTTGRETRTNERTGALLATRRASARRCGVALGVLAVAVAVLAGCGVPVDDGPTALARAGVPFNLLAPSTPSTSAPTVPPSPSQTVVQVFLLGVAGHLVPVSRSVAGAQGTQAELTAALEALVAGPTLAETVQEGLQSAIPPQTTLVGVTIGPQGLVTVDLGGTFAQLVGLDQIEAVAQVVFTAIEFSGVTALTFQLSGQPIAVPTETGEQVRVVNESQYTSLAPAPPAPHNVTP
jgi:Sporulation and spore germination